MGTGFGEGGVCTPGGVQKIFQGGILLVDPGVILPKIITLGVPSGPPGAPPAFDRGMCWVILGFRGGVHPPHPPPPPCPSMSCIEILGFCCWLILDYLNMGPWQKKGQRLRTQFSVNHNSCKSPEFRVLILVIHGVPNINLLIQTAITLKISISQPLISKIKCQLFFHVRLQLLIWST